MPGSYWATRDVLLLALAVVTALSSAFSIYSAWRVHRRLRDFEPPSRVRPAKASKLFVVPRRR